MTMNLRCGGRCWWCTKELKDQVARHHRQRRQVGGDHLSNLVLLHPNCHNLHHSSVHQNPYEAISLGFIVPTWAEPIAYPIFASNKWWLLDDAGTMLPSKKPD